MITRRNLLMGLAGGVAAATAAATLVRTSAPKALGWPFRKGLTQADLPRPHALLKPRAPKYEFTQDKDTGICSLKQDQLTLISGGVEVMRITPGPPPTMYIKKGVKVRDILDIATGQPV